MCAHLADNSQHRYRFTRHPSWYHTLLTKLSTLLVLAFFCLIISDWLGLRFNHSQSVEPGFYWVVEKQPAKGDFVSFCPAKGPITQIAYERGYIGFGNCSGKTERLLKIVYGVTGDTIELTPKGVVINGDLLPVSATFTQDGLGRPLPVYGQKRHVLQANELWVMTNRSALSFDSRYFGPILVNQVSDVVRPLLTWQ